MKKMNVPHPVSLALLLCVVFFNWHCEQEAPNPLASETENVYDTLSKQATFQKYDSAPEPIGGFAAITRNLTYPVLAKKAGIQGRVIVNVFVNKNGRVDAVKVLKSLGNNGCDQAAIAAVKAVEWEPAKHNDRPVSVWVGVPVIFRLGDSFSVDAENAEDSDAYNGFFDNLAMQSAYPATAKAAGIEGKVIVNVFVDKNGDVIDATKAQGGGHPEGVLEMAAIDLVRNKKWPIMRESGNTPAQYKQQVEIEFKDNRVLVQPLSMTLIK